jgi:hypothetical protein
LQTLVAVTLCCEGSVHPGSTVIIWWRCYDRILLQGEETGFLSHELSHLTFLLTSCTISANSSDLPISLNHSLCPAARDSKTRKFPSRLPTPQPLHLFLDIPFPPTAPLSIDCKFQRSTRPSEAAENPQSSPNLQSTTPILAPLKWQTASQPHA